MEKKGNSCFEIDINLDDPTSLIRYQHELYAFDGYKVARNRFRDFKTELSVSGIYILDAGVWDGKQHLYIGQSENLLERLRSHNSKPPKSLEWKCALCFVYDKMKERSRLRIEKRLVEQFRGLCDRFKVYTEKATSEQFDDDDTLISVMREIKSFLSVMGIDPYNENEIAEKTQQFYCKVPKARDKMAYGYFSRGEFVVKAGSWVSAEKKTGFRPSSYWETRQKLEDAEEIKEGKFTHIVRFRSASEAAAVVCGRSANGQDEWLTKINGVEITMKEFFEDNHNAVT